MPDECQADLHEGIDAIKHALFISPHYFTAKMIKCIIFLSLILNVQFVITISRLKALLQSQFFFCVVAILCLFI